MNKQITHTHLQKDTEIIWNVWRDKKTGIQGFVSVFGSGKTRASGGGIRVSPSITLALVKQIAQIMRKKFFLTGPGDRQTGEPIDGAGIGICAIPEQVTPDVLTRFLTDTDCVTLGIGAAASTGIATTGVCEHLGLVHLQEPIARALNCSQRSLHIAQKCLAMTQNHVPHQLSLRHNAPANLATGITAAEIVNRFFLKLKGKRVGLIGFGAAGGSFAHRSVALGANIIFVANSEGAIRINNSIHEIPLLLQKIRKGHAPVPRLHLSDIDRPVSVPTILQHTVFDVLVMAPTEGVIGKSVVDAIPSKTTIISIANMPWADDVREEAQRSFCIISPNMINLGNAVLHSLASLGCRAKNAQELLDRTVTCAQHIVAEATSHSCKQDDTTWHKIIPKFL